MSTCVQAKGVENPLLTPAFRSTRAAGAVDPERSEGTGRFPSRHLQKATESGEGLKRRLFGGGTGRFFALREKYRSHL
jgi:hypothetical protein